MYQIKSNFVALIFNQYEMKTTKHELTVDQRIVQFNRTTKQLLSSQKKTMKYLESTGIYSKEGKLTKAYK